MKVKRNRVILIGGGHSVAEGISQGLWDKIKGEEIWSLNYCYKIMPYLPSKELWIDRGFFTINIDDMQKLSEQGVPLLAAYNSKYKDFSEVKTYTTTRDPQAYFGRNAFERNKIFVGTMGQTGFFALSLAIAMGYDEIFLLGFDFGTPNYNQTFTHFYQNEAEKLNIISKGIAKTDVYYNKEGRLKLGINDYEVYLKTCSFYDIVIYNVSLLSNIKVFPKINYKIMFELLKENKNE